MQKSPGDGTGIKDEETVYDGKAEGRTIWGKEKNQPEGQRVWRKVVNGQIRVKYNNMHV